MTITNWLCRNCGREMPMEALDDDGFCAGCREEPQDAAEQIRSAHLKEIMDVLGREPIRLCDGRWSGGFVDLEELLHLVASSQVAKEKRGDVTFVVAKRPPSGGEVK